MSFADELAALYNRDLTRLIQQLQAFPDDATAWRTLPGATNSAGNLTLHLEGNLREYIGRQLGGVAYQRTRPQEFALTGIPIADLVTRIEAVRALVPKVIASLSDEQMRATFPENVLGPPITTQQFLTHLHSHLNYHLGQVDYLRRILTGGVAVAYAGL